MTPTYRSRRPDWWPRFEAVDWALLAGAAAAFGFELLVIWLLTEGV